MSGRAPRWLACVVVLAASVTLAACGSDDGADRQALADIALQVAQVDGARATQAQVDFYAGHITDEFAQAFGAESVEACVQDVPACIGDPLHHPMVDPSKVKIDGDSATLTLAADEGTFGLDAVKQDGTWKLSGLFAASDDIPSGVETVEMDLEDFAFGFDPTDPALAAGKFAFHVTNRGSQTHEVVLLRLPPNTSLADMLQSEDSQEPDVIAVKFPFAPGDEANMAVPQLEPGNYALVCFLPDTSDPSLTPHAFKGMTAEFSVR